MTKRGLELLPGKIKIVADPPLSQPPMDMPKVIPIHQVIMTMVTTFIMYPGGLGI